MATRDAIYSTCESIIRLLRANRYQLDFGSDVQIDGFRPVSGTGNIMNPGVALHLYRVYHNSSHRSPAGRIIDNKRQPTKLPVDLHFFLSIWAEEPSRQQEIAGWMMRVMEDNPIIPASMLNAPRSDVFQNDEAVEIVLADLSTEDLFRIWEVLVENRYQLSVPYIARRIDIESDQRMAEFRPVRERLQDIQPARATETELM